MQVNDLKKNIIELLEKDKEFRYTIAGLIGYKELLDRIVKIEEGLLKVSERLVKIDERVVKVEERLADHDKKFNAIMEEIKSLRESDTLLRADMNEGFKRLDLNISALGARRGIMNEQSVGNALKGIIEKDLGYKAEEFNIHDDGYAYGYPSNIQLDIVISNSKVILVEISAHIKRSDPFIAKKAELYYKKEKKKIDKILFVTPFIDDDAKDACNRLGIEVYSID